MAVINTLKNGGSDTMWLARIAGDFEARRDGYKWPEAHTFISSATSNPSGDTFEFDDGSWLTTNPSDSGYTISDEYGIFEITDPDITQLNCASKVNGGYFVGSTKTWPASDASQTTTTVYGQNDGYIHFIDSATHTLHKIQANGTMGAVAGAYKSETKCFVLVQVGVPATADVDPTVELGTVDLVNYTYTKVGDVSVIGRGAKIEFATDNMVIYRRDYWPDSSSSTHNYFVRIYDVINNRLLNVDVNNENRQIYTIYEKRTFSLLLVSGSLYFFKTAGWLVVWDDEQHTIIATANIGSQGTSTLLYNDADVAIFGYGVLDNSGKYTGSYLYRYLFNAADGVLKLKMLKNFGTYASITKEHIIPTDEGIFISAGRPHGFGLVLYRPLQDDLLESGYYGGGYRQPIIKNGTYYFLPRHSRTLSAEQGADVTNSIITYSSANGFGALFPYGYDSTRDASEVEAAARVYTCIQITSDLLYVACVNPTNTARVDLRAYSFPNDHFSVVKNTLGFEPVFMALEPNANFVFFVGLSGNGSSGGFMEYDRSTQKSYLLQPFRDFSGGEIYYSGFENGPYEKNSIVIMMPTKSGTREDEKFGYAYDMTTRRVIKFSEVALFRYLSYMYNLHK